MNSDDHKIKHSNCYLLKIRGRNIYGFGEFSSVYNITTKYEFKDVWDESWKGPTMVITDKGKTVSRHNNGSSYESCFLKNTVSKGKHI